MVKLCVGGRERGGGGQMRENVEEFKQWDGRGRNDHDCVVIHCLAQRQGLHWMGRGPLGALFPPVAPGVAI